MLLLLNIIVLVYVLAMAYFWGSVQGLFSGFLNLLCAIVAGALALALWEPLVVGALLGRMGAIGWGLGLAGPFIIFLVILRLAVDNLVRGNVLFPQVVNWLAGGLCGFLTGVITGGILLIGLGALPMGEELFGYQPLNIDSTTKTNMVKVDTDRETRRPLWLPID